MSEPVSATPEPAADDDPFRIIPHCAESHCVTNPITGGVAFLSPPGTPPVTFEEVRRLLEDFP